MKVTDVRDTAFASAPDDEILEYAVSKSLVLVTRDAEFANPLRHPKHTGIIVLRLPYHFKFQQINAALEEFLKEAKGIEFQKAVVLVELGKYRLRK